MAGRGGDPIVDGPRIAPGDGPADAPGDRPADAPGGEDVVDVGGTPPSAVMRVPARVGLVGNPSDGYGGAVLATPFLAFEATVVAHASAEVRMVGPAGVAAWPTLDAWRHDVTARGHGDEQRIVSAALWVLVGHLRARLGAVGGRGGHPGGDEPAGVTVRWGTDIPRSVGLAGSSAIAVAVIEAAARTWEVPLDPRVVAALALRAERDVLGIAAGWQDRIVQAHRCTVLVDAAVTDAVDGVEVPGARPIEAGGHSGARLVVGWSSSAGESSDSYHAPLRRAAASLAAPMADLGALARRAAAAWAHGDLAEVAAAVHAGWRLRQGCAPLRADHAAVVDVLRDAGLAATTPGSGGSVVALCLDEAEVSRALAALAAAGLSASVQSVA